MRVSRVFALLLGLGTLWGIVLADQGDYLTIRQFSRYVPGGDAGLHVGVMGGLTLAFSIGFADARIAGRRLGVIGVVLLIVLFATAEELHQWFQPYRRFTLRDLLFSYLGIGLAALLVLGIRRRR
ncbi:MAG: VanZ family protein [Myxococcota bacterium]